MQQVLLVQLVETVVKLELRDHEEAGVKCESFLPLTWRHSFLVRRPEHAVLRIDLVSLLQLGKLIGDECVQREALDWDVGRGQHVQHVELERHGAFLPNREDLEPPKALSSLYERNKVVPLFAREWMLNIDLEALQLGLWLLRLLLTLLQWLRLHDRRACLNALPQ